MEHDEQSARSHPLEPGSEAPPGSPAEEANTPIVKRYKAAGVTVVWKPALCIHAKVCWKGLPEVFNPKARPWVNISGAEADRIITQVGQCPSGALSIEKKQERNRRPAQPPRALKFCPAARPLCTAPPRLYTPTVAPKSAKEKYPFAAAALRVLNLSAMAVTPASGLKKNPALHP